MMHVYSWSSKWVEGIGGIKTATHSSRLPARVQKIMTITFAEIIFTLHFRLVLKHKQNLLFLELLNIPLVRC